MRWLQWSTYDLARGIGGVEVHARCLEREFAQMGIDPVLSNDPTTLNDPGWHVIHTHGSSTIPLLHPLLKKKRGKRPLLVHTLHGVTLGRMSACGEWTWPGGYLAAARETRAVAHADLILAVRPGLYLYDWAGAVRKSRAICGNGWDSGLADEPLASGLTQKIQTLSPFWAFIGRGGDPVKGADLLQKAIPLLPGLQWVAAPGEGFDEAFDVLQTGALTPGQVRTLLKQAEGLVVSSRYEGNALVVLEALAQGLPVATTPVGMAPYFAVSGENAIQGLIRAESVEPGAIAEAVRAARRLRPEARAWRAEQNQKCLPTWRQVAEKISVAAREALNFA